MKKSIARITSQYSLQVILALLLLMQLTSLAQQGVSISANASPPHPSAGLDVNFNDKGFLPPRLTTAQRNAIINPAAGLQVYNTENECLEIYAGGQWNSIWCYCVESTAPTGISGTNSLCAGNGTLLSVEGGSLGTGASWQWYSGSCGGTPEGTGSEINVTPGATINYYVRAVGNCSTTVCTQVTVTVNAIPAAPVSTAATNISQSGFQANWNASSGATTYFLDVSTSPVFGSFVAGYNNLEVGNTTNYSVSGLSEFTTYYYRVRAQADCGTSPGSNVNTVATIGPVLYAFTNCGQTGRQGPSQSQCSSSYSMTSLDGLVTVNSGIQQFAIPYSGTYRVTAKGAAGGGAPKNSLLGGRGAIIQGDFYFTAGEVVKVLVGQMGTAPPANGSGDGGGGAGGGGSFVVRSDNTIVVIAGGGGGASGDYVNDTNHGYDAATGTSGVDGQYGGGYKGINGQGATRGPSYTGGGGGGFLTNGEAAGSSPGSPYSGGSFQGGFAFLNGGEGGNVPSPDSPGGFGGGGVGHAAYANTSGGGGGYSGGGGGGLSYSVQSYGSGGGGGSFLHSSVQNPATSNGSWSTTGSEPQSVYSGSVTDIGSWNNSQGAVQIELIN